MSVARRQVLAGLAAAAAAPALPITAAAIPTPGSHKALLAEFDVRWEPQAGYVMGSVFCHGDDLFICRVDHVAGDVFEPQFWWRFPLEASR